MGQNSGNSIKQIALWVVVFAAAVSLGLWSSGRSGVLRERAEREHGILLPSSARDIQCRGDAGRGFLDRGAVTMFEMDAGELAAFVGQVTVNSRTAPVRTHGDPRVNGWNVWPEGASSFVPVESVYAGFERTWVGEPTPIEMLNCSSPTGDFLHLEFWRLESGSLLVKIYTDWN